jgi:hypothetical protein
MRISNFFRLLFRMVAVPVAWCIAVVSSSVATPLPNHPESASPRSETSSDRMATLHSLLGEELVPSERVESRTATPELTPWRVVQGRGPATGSPPPPPPPPP